MAITELGFDGGAVGASNPLPVNSELPAAAALADGTALPTTPLVGSAVQHYNGSTLDLARANTNITVLASAARTATLQSSDITNYNGRGLHLVIDVTAA